MFERFTSRARAMMVLAQVEARSLNHNYIGTEHILLGLVHEGEGVAAEALESLGIGLDSVRQQVEEIIGRGEQTRAPSGHIPFTPRAKKVLELSLRESLQLGHNYIGTEHILLGLIREGDGVAAQVLVRLGADHDRVRAQVVHLLVAREGAERAPGSGESVSGIRARSSRLLRSQGSASLRVSAGREAGLREALEIIADRLGAIEDRLGIAHHGADPSAGPGAGPGTGPSHRSREELERELARLTSVLREHGIDPDAVPAAGPADVGAAAHAASAAAAAVPEAGAAVPVAGTVPEAGAVVPGGGTVPEAGTAAEAGAVRGADAVPEAGAVGGAEAGTGGPEAGTVPEAEAGTVPEADTAVPEADAAPEE